MSKQKINKIMTVAYSNQVFSSRGVDIFLRLLFRWKGSIYKLVWVELCIYVLLYSILSILYRFILGPEGNYCTKTNIFFYLSFV